jgi:hypothetical protein
VDHAYVPTRDLRDGPRFAIFAVQIVQTGFRLHTFIAIYY